MKFGGTSVGSVDSILKVKQIVEAEKEPVIVVVSALGGITDQLIRTAAMATQGNIAYETEFDCMVRRHEDMIQQVIPSGSKKRALGKKIHALLDELKDIYQGLYLLKDISSNMEDTVVSYGERLSSLIVGAVIEDAEVFDSRAFMKTERKHHKHLLDSELSEQLIR
jgi:aspartokinase/homoserine dehydrogenase 1